MTKWFPADVKPVREGMYETIIDGSEIITYSFWRGCWTAAGENKKWVIQKDAEGQRSYWQEREWRGLAKEPK